MLNRDIGWRPLETSGLEHLSLRPGGDGGLVASSVVIGARDAPRYGVRYRIELDPAWRTRLLLVETTDGRALHLRADGAGHWTDEAGTALPALDGCIDVDLAGSPFTNTLPIRRLALDTAAAPVEIRAAFVPFDSFSPLADAQRYTLLPDAPADERAGAPTGGRGDGLAGERRYRYEAVDGTFAAEFAVDADGLVTDYPPLFTRS